MADLLWPGDERAGDLFSDGALLKAMVDVEGAWLAALVSAGVAPSSADAHLDSLVTSDLLERLAREAESGGNPAMALVSWLRGALEDTCPETARWLHRGLTSQDVVDSALMLCARDATTQLRAALVDQIDCLARLVETHSATPMVARTLTQHAVPTTFGLKAAGWLTGVLDAYDDVAALVLPVQAGGAAGTMAGAVELASALPEPLEVVHRMTQDFTARLGLAPSIPWPTSRAAITRLADATVRCTDAWGRIANDVLTLSRPEIGELSEGTGGGSSTLPHKANPVLSTLVRRAALTTPQLAATLHLAAAEAADERSAGPWHAEWATLRTLLRRAVVAGDQTRELLSGLRVHTDRMLHALAAAREDVHAEQRSLADLTGSAPRESYVGASAMFVEATLARATGVLAGAGSATARAEESR